MNLGKIYLGCAVWSYKGWVGNFYPPKTQPKSFLNLYSHEFNTVEGNTTFYAVPQVKTVAKWNKETTNNFQFCPKFPKQITHQGLLESKIEEGLNFLKIISGLDDKLGLVFAQLPPSYSPNYLEDLRRFLPAFQSYNLAVEVRHSAWFIEPNKTQLNNLLTELNITRVLLDTRPIYNCDDDPQINSQRKKPNLPLQEIVTNNCVLVRFIGHPNPKYNQSYLKQWAVRVSKWLKTGITVYFFVHCPLEEYSPQTANYFKALLKRQQVNVECISTNIEEEPTQLSLF